MHLGGPRRSLTGKRCRTPKWTYGTSVALKLIYQKHARVSGLRSNPCSARA